MDMRPQTSLLDIGVVDAILKGFATGVLLTAGDGNVIYMNEAARRRIAAGAAIRIVNNRFRPTDPTAARAFAAVLAPVDADDLPASPCGQALALPDRNGLGVVAIVLPLRTFGHAPDPGELAAAIFLHDPTAAPYFPAEAFAQLYGLTQAELRVVLGMISCGATLAIARKLGLSLHTVKTHMKHIFQKTDTSRQVDLMLLISRVSGPTGVATDQNGAARIGV